MKTRFGVILLSLATILTIPAMGQETAFSYQGRLLDNGQAANGQYDFQFYLRDAPLAGNAVGGTNALPGVAVNGGLFAISLDFGAPAFDGTGRWLEVAVRTNGNSSFTTLAPRQKITATPYAIRSLSALTADTASSAIALGGIVATQFVQTGDPRLSDPRLPAGGSSNYIQNTALSEFAITQPDSSFSISGNGEVGGFLSAFKGILGTSSIPSGNGVAGLGDGAGVNGYSSTGYGVIGRSDGGTGVYGTSDGFPTGNVPSYGVYGLITGGSTTNAGVYGKSTVPNGSGVLGQADNGDNAYGVWGKAAQGKGVVGESRAGFGVYGVTSASSGKIDVAGIYGRSTATNGNGVIGEANSGSDARGVWGSSATGTGVYGSSSALGGVGVMGRVLFATASYGVWGQSGGAQGQGVHAEATGSDGIGLYATGPTGIQAWGNPALDVWGVDPRAGGFGVAARFAGEVDAGVIKATAISGTRLDISGTKNFKIDHPLDPANKYLYHASIESSDVLNLYSGNVRLDGKGEAVVQLPEWFGALNTDFRYQLTSIGAPGPELYVAEEIHNNQFKIAGGKPDAKVSWQVTSVRQDPYIKAHPIAVEEEKTGTERGKYLFPEGYGLSAAYAINPIDLAGKGPGLHQSGTSRPAGGP